MPDQTDGLRVLVVDDDVESATTFSVLLQMQGCRTAAAFGAADGLSILKLLKPDLAFIDLSMPGTDGCYTLKVFKTGVPAVHPLYVCLTGHAGFESQALEAGFDRYVVKPMEPVVLADILTEARRRAAAQRASEAA